MTLEEIKQRITPILEEFGVEYAGLFGSFARGENSPDSDIDILVRLGGPMGMFKYMRLVNKLEESLHKKVDFVTERSLSRFVKPHILPDLKTIYEKR